MSSKCLERPDREPQTAPILMKTEIKPRKFRQTEALSAARAQIRCAIYYRRRPAITARQVVQSTLPKL